MKDVNSLITGAHGLKAANVKLTRVDFRNHGKIYTLVTSLLPLLPLLLVLLLLVLLLLVLLLLVLLPRSYLSLLLRNLNLKGIKVYELRFEIFWTLLRLRMYRHMLRLLPLV
jgi:hypothetical protein